MVLFHQLNFGDFNCIQSVKPAEIESHVVLSHHLNSKDFNCIQVVKCTEIGPQVLLLSSAEF